MQAKPCIFFSRELLYGKYGLISNRISSSKLAIGDSMRLCSLHCRILHRFPIWNSVRNYRLLFLVGLRGILVKG